MEHAHEPDAAAREPASDIDEQILVMWRALRANPSLDARWAMQVIDRLLDQRPRQGTPAALGLLPARDQPGQKDLRGSARHCGRLTEKEKPGLGAQAGRCPAALGGEGLPDSS